MRKHRLAERLLTDVIGLDWEHVHVEACRWEHVMSEQVERRLLEVLGNHPRWHLEPYWRFGWHGHSFIVEDRGLWP